MIWTPRQSAARVRGSAETGLFCRRYDVVVLVHQPRERWEIHWELEEGLGQRAINLETR